jgi:hypothetical protein
MSISKSNGSYAYNFLHAIGIGLSAEGKLRTQNYWVFGLYPPSGILETRKQNVSECYKPSLTIL